MLKWLFGTPAQRAGRKAGISWQTVLYQTGTDIKTLTGKKLYEHACEEAKRWLRSSYKSGKEYYGSWSLEEKRNPENVYHDEYLEYIEAFVSEFPSRLQGNPKY